MTDATCFHSYVDPEKLNRRPWGRGRKKKKRLERETQNPKQAPGPEPSAQSPIQDLNP